MKIPLPQIDFGDINKFEASSGLFIIIASTISLYIDANNHKINIWVKLAMFGAGLFALIWGLIKWRKRQDNLDRLLQLEVSEKERLVSASDDDKKEKLNKEFTISHIDNNKPMAVSFGGASTQSPQAHNYYQNSIKIESAIFSHLRNLNNPHYTPLFSQKVGPFVYDVILKANKREFEDKLFEIKYLENTLSDNYISQILSSIEIMFSMYKRNINDKAKMVLIIVYNNNSLNSSKMRLKVLECATKYSGLMGMSAEFISETDIDTINYNIF